MNVYVCGGGVVMIIILSIQYSQISILTNTISECGELANITYAYGGVSQCVVCGSTIRCQRESVRERCLQVQIEN